MMFFPRRSPNTENGLKPDTSPLRSSRTCCGLSRRLWIFLIAVLILIVGLALGLGLGLGLRNSNDTGDDNDSDSSGSGPPNVQPPSGNTTTPGVNGTFWQPKAGATWQIVLEQPPSNFTHHVAIYDIDLFDNNASSIAQIQALGSKVICYFSAGSYEPDRPDSNDFLPKDYGKELDGWPGEKWLDTTSPNVRSIMTKRIQLASEKGCDGVDPDNVDGFDNDSGLPLTNTTALDYLHFLATAAHSLKLAIGLKNAGAIVNETTGFLQWVVNEQCVIYDECDLFRPYIDAGKPVLHIEYTDEKGNNDVDARSREEMCGDADETGFSTLIKKMDLDDWVEPC